MTEKKRRGRPRKQPTDVEDFLTMNDRYDTFASKAAKVNKKHTSIETGNLPVDKSDGSTASYYELPEGAVELQDLISYKNMNAQIGEIFRSCYRFGQASHSDKLRDAKKIKFYILAEIKRLEAMLEKLNEERGRKGV